MEKELPFNKAIDRITNLHQDYKQLKSNTIDQIHKMERAYRLLLLSNQKRESLGTIFVHEVLCDMIRSLYPYGNATEKATLDKVFKNLKKFKETHAPRKPIADKD